MENEEAFRQLINSMREGDIGTFKSMLVKSPGLAFACDNTGIPFQFLAARYGGIEFVKFVVEETNANLIDTDKNGNNMLHYAAMGGKSDVCKYLVKRCNLSPTTPNLDLITPYEIAYHCAVTDIPKTGIPVPCTCDLVDFFADYSNINLLGASYKNPILRGAFPDPSIVRVGDDFYMVNSSFVYFPCIPISHSKDLVHWEIIGHAITDPKESRLDGLYGGSGYWAPDISYDDGLFYITATYRLNENTGSCRKQMVVTAKNPQGPYSKPVFLDVNGIDPSLYHENGRHYMLLNRGARIFEISADGSRRLSEPRLLFLGDYKRSTEGPHVFKRKGYYYLILAEGGTGSRHRISVARSDSLMGVYKPCPYNPIMRQAYEDRTIQRCGHGKMVELADGRWYMVYLCGRLYEGKYTIMGRETAMDPVTWTPDGWPIVNHLNGPSALQESPFIMDRNEPVKTEAFLPLSKNWITPHPPEEGGISRKGDQLMISGSREPLDSIQAKNILLRRQTEFVFTSRVDVGFQELLEDQEDGLIAYYDENSWICFGLKEKSGKYYLQVIENIGGEKKYSDSVPVQRCAGGSITLLMRTDHLKRSFSFIDADAVEKKVFAIENAYYLTDEGLRMGRRFTGDMLGLYAYAGNSAHKGIFKNFMYAPKRGDEL